MLRCLIDLCIYLCLHHRQDVVAACLTSLEEAGIQIAKRKTMLDGQLFLIKHLLIVREQIAPFHIECIFREVNLDFDRVKSEFYAGAVDDMFD